MSGANFVGPLFMMLLIAGGAQAVVIETVTVGNPGNPDDADGYGGVDYSFNIGKFEVTARQYTEFLNAVAAIDTYGLYSEKMSDPSTQFVWGCNIQRSGALGSYTYSVEPDWADRPVNYVSWGDAARFCNWLHNGQPTGAQDLSTTEGGSYYLNGATSDFALLAILREDDATWVIPSEDEWKKAAYHYNDGATGNYYRYPTGTDAPPNNGNPEGDTGNSANFFDGDDGDYAIDAPYWRTEVGFFGLSESPYGTFDQGGNVSEWNESVIYNVNRCRRGGSFRGYSFFLLSGGRNGSAPTTEYDSYGFRVAQVSYSADLDGDGDVDMGDFASFQVRFAGDLSGFVTFYSRFAGPQ